WWIAPAGHIRLRQPGDVVAKDVGFGNILEPVGRQHGRRDGESEGGGGRQHQPQSLRLQFSSSCRLDRSESPAQRPARWGGRRIDGGTPLLIRSRSEQRVLIVTRHPHTLSIGGCRDRKSVV